MELQDGIIQMTVEDFRNLIKEEVAKCTVSDVSSKNVFSDVCLRDKDILDINSRYSISDLKYHTTNVCGNPIWVRKLSNIYSIDKKRNELNEPTHDSGLYNNDIHNLIRVLALNVYGVKKNKDLHPSDYILAENTYQKIKNVFLSEYDARLKRLNETTGN